MAGLAIKSRQQKVHLLQRMAVDERLLQLSHESTRILPKPMLGKRRAVYGTSRNLLHPTAELQATRTPLHSNGMARIWKRQRPTLIAMVLQTVRMRVLVAIIEILAGCDPGTAQSVSLEPGNPNDFYPNKLCITYISILYLPGRAPHMHDLVLIQESPYHTPTSRPISIPLRWRRFPSKVFSQVMRNNFTKHLRTAFLPFSSPTKDVLRRISRYTGGFYVSIWHLTSLCKGLVMFGVKGSGILGVS